MSASSPEEPVLDSPSAASAQQSEMGDAAGLVNSANKPKYINLLNNVAALIFFVIICYLCFQNGSTLFSYHPVLMSLAWIVFMPIAIHAITPGDLATEWMPVKLRSARHWIVQIFTVASALAGFFIIVSNKILHDKPHFVSLHAIFGLVSVISMAFVVCGGVGALYSLKLKNYVAPIWMKTIHSLFGLVVFLLGGTTCILGIFSKWFKFGEAMRYICLLLIVLVMVLTVLRPSCKLYFRIKERYQRI